MWKNVHAGFALLRSSGLCLTKAGRFSVSRSTATVMVKTQRTYLGKAAVSGVVFANLFSICKAEDNLNKQAKLGNHEASDTSQYALEIEVPKDKVFLPILRLLYPLEDSCEASHEANAIPSLLPVHNKPTIYILRGVPGSGKSSVASFIAGLADPPTSIVICSADHYFLQQDGTYNFSAQLLGEAHSSCRKKARDSMLKRVNTIIIDNTNTTRIEAKPYVEMAVKYEYRLVIAEPSTPWRMDVDKLSKCNKHHVPAETIARMLQRWESFDSVEQILAEIPPRRYTRKVHNDRSPRTSSASEA